MTKILNKLIAIILGLTMTVGVGFAIAETSKAVQVNASSLTTGYTKITDVDDLSTGDKIVIYNDSLSSGVTGMNTSTNKDVTISETSSEWIQYEVTKSSTTFTLKTGTNYINIVNKAIKYGSATNLTVTATGALSDTASTPNILQANSTYYRPYADNSKYSKFFVYKVDGSTPTEYHDIIFNANGDNVTNMPANLTNKTGIVSLSNVSSPSREHYIFSGWSLTADGDVITSVTITNSDVNVYAIWEVEPAPSSDSYKYYKITDINNITSGKYLIVVDLTSSYAMTQTLASGKYAFSDALTITDDYILSSDVSDVEFEFVGDKDGITIKNSSNDKYVKYVSSTNLGEDTESYTWTIAEGTKGSFRIKSQTSGRCLTPREGTTNKFGGYASSNITSTSEYYDVELYRAFEASDFAYNIMNKITCNAQGTSAPTYVDDYSWTVLKTEFNDKLTKEQRDLLIEADALENGNIIQQAMARYDYIVAKYKYENFIGRTILGGAKVGFSTPATDDMTTLLIIACLVSITTIAMFIIVKKIKQH